MGLFDDLKRLARPYDEEDYEDDYEEELEDDAADRRGIRDLFGGAGKNRETREPARETRAAAAPARAAEERRYNNNNKVVNIHTTTQLQVVLVKPNRFEEAAEIADHLRERRTVVLNLETTNKEIARRLVDFLSGVAYANEGKIKKVAVNTYIITPCNVNILGDLLDELENNGMYF